MADKPLDDANRAGEIQAAGRKLASPGVITQYTDKGRAKHQVKCLRLGSLAISETMLFALEGEYVQGFVYLADMRALRVEWRRSFKHPIVGAIVGAVMLVASVVLLWAGFSGAAWGPKSDVLILGEVFLALVGAYTLWEVIRCRQVPFLVIDTKDEQRSFEIHGGLSNEVERLTDALAVAVSGTGGNFEKGN